ncbi:MAG: hypothetical protein AMXMBFR56_21710 [Polyangiaceae bacterium]
MIPGSACGLAGLHQVLLSGLHQVLLLGLLLLSGLLLRSQVPRQPSRSRLRDRLPVTHASTAEAFPPPRLPPGHPCLSLVVHDPVPVEQVGSNSPQPTDLTLVVRAFVQEWTPTLVWPTAACPKGGGFG